ncbi:MAG: hypothetical protein JWN22_2741 [Nocardioides sp.]|nr:hypothetical protein [Nocardioides sp.]
MDLLRSVADVAVPARHLARRVRELEVAMQENSALEVLLERQVTRLEQALLPVLEAAVGPAGERHDGD